MKTVVDVLNGGELIYEGRGVSYFQFKTINEAEKACVALTCVNDKIDAHAAFCMAKKQFSGQGNHGIKSIDEVQGDCLDLKALEYGYFLNTNVHFLFGKDEVQEKLEALHEDDCSDDELRSIFLSMGDDDVIQVTSCECINLGAKPMSLMDDIYTFECVPCVIAYHSYDELLAFDKEDDNEIS